MIRHLFAALMLALAVVTLPFAASAQTDSDRTRAFASWSQELGLYSQRAIEFIEVANPAYEIMADVQAGNTDRDTALSRIAAWRAEVNSQLDVYRSQGAVLAEGPQYSVAGQEAAIVLMREMPNQVLATVTGYFDSVEQQARDMANGAEADPYAIQVAQLALFQDYYSGLMGMNQTAREGVETSHPQYHLLGSMVVNMESTILALEVARQRMGGEASVYAVVDYGVELEANAAEVRTHIAEARQAYNRLEAQLVDARRGATGETARQMNLLSQMFATYPASFEAEINGANMLLTTLSDVTPVSATDRYDVWLTQLSAYETQRDGLQLERQRIASGF